VAEINGEIVGSLGLVSSGLVVQSQGSILYGSVVLHLSATCHLGVGAGLQAEAHATAARAGADS
jgi:hypothetical protein